MEKIPDARLVSARRKLKKEVAIALLKGMVERDIDFAYLAYKLNSDEDDIRSFLFGLIDDKNDDLNDLSDIATAMDCEVLVYVEVNHLGPRKEV